MVIWIGDTEIRITQYEHVLHSFVAMILYVYVCRCTVERAGDKASVPGRGQDPAETVQSVPQSSAGQDVEGRAEGADEEDEGRTVAEDGDVVTAVRCQHCRDD